MMRSTGAITLKTRQEAGRDHLVFGTRNPKITAPRSATNCTRTIGKKGIMSEAEIHGIIEYGFEVLNLHSIGGLVCWDPANAPQSSGAIREKWVY